jgi:hypothetical protein
MADRVDPYIAHTTSPSGWTTSPGRASRECSGLENSQNATEYREGTDKNQAVRKQPGLVTHGDITLSRGHHQ